MNFPNISFFFKLNEYYFFYREFFLFSYYFRLHNILFTNLYIRIYRYKLNKQENKNVNMNLKEKYTKINRDLFADKIKKKKRGFIRRKINKKVEYKASVSNRLGEENNKITSRSFMYTSINMMANFDLDNVKNDSFKNQRRESYKNQKKDSYKHSSKKKKNYIFINKFKDCGNHYNFDPFYPGTTYKLKEFNFYRTNKLKKKNKNSELKKQKLDLSVFDSRLSNLNYKYFNTHIYNILLEVSNNKKVDRNNFLFTLKNDIVFFFYFLRFFKKRISYLLFTINNFKEVLSRYYNKLNMINDIFNLEQSELDSVFAYIKVRKFKLFKVYHKLLSLHSNSIIKLNTLVDRYNMYTNIYNSFYVDLKNRYTKLSKSRKSKFKLSDHIKQVVKGEKLHEIVTSSYADSLINFNFSDISKWEKRNVKNSLYISLNKYVTLYRSILKYNYLKSHYSNNAIFYIKATATNVYLYFIYNNKLLFKKSCGELPDVKKKERRFWRNIFPLVESLLPSLVKMKAKYKFPFISLYLNGSSSLCSPLISRMRKHNKKFRRLVYFLFNEMEFFYNKTLEIKHKYQKRYILYPVYRLKYYSIVDGFNKLSKIFFAINKVKDITSWPYNGCKKKKKKKKEKC